MKEWRLRKNVVLVVLGKEDAKDGFKVDGLNITIRLTWRALLRILVWGQPKARQEDPTKLHVKSGCC